MLPRLRRPKCQTPASLLKASRWAVVALGLVASGGTALSFSRKQHRFVRLFDFPRVQLAITGTIAGALFRRFFWRGTPADHAFLITTAAAVAWQARKIRPYTRWSRVRVQRSSRSGGRGAERGATTFRLLISNV